MWKLGKLFMLLIVTGLARGQLTCYSCRGSDCVLPSEDQVEECDVAALLPTTTTEPPTEEPTTDSDMNFDTSDNSDVVQVAEYPLLENLEASVEVNDERIEIITSGLPGDNVSLRRLQQALVDEVRCVVATYNEAETGALSVVRSCAILQEDDESTCATQVDGDLLSCYVCDTDLCNSAVKLTASTAFLIALLVSVRNLSS